MTVHELLGRTVEQLETEKTEHSRTVSVLEMLKTGAAKLEHLEIVNENGSLRWTLTIPKATSEQKADG